MITPLAYAIMAIHVLLTFKFITQSDTIRQKRPRNIKTMRTHYLSRRIVSSGKTILFIFIDLSVAYMPASHGLSTMTSLATKSSVGNSLAGLNN